MTYEYAEKRLQELSQMKAEVITNIAGTDDEEQRTDLIQTLENLIYETRLIKSIMYYIDNGVTKYVVTSGFNQKAVIRD